MKQKLMTEEEQVKVPQYQMIELQYGNITSDEPQTISDFTEEIDWRVAKISEQLKKITFQKNISTQLISPITYCLGQLQAIARMLKIIKIKTLKSEEETNIAYQRNRDLVKEAGIAEGKIRELEKIRDRAEEQKQRDEQTIEHLKQLMSTTQNWNKLSEQKRKQLGRVLDQKRIQLNDSLKQKAELQKQIRDLEKQREINQKKLNEKNKQIIGMQNQIIRKDLEIKKHRQFSQQWHNSTEPLPNKQKKKTEYQILTRTNALFFLANLAISFFPQSLQLIFSLEQKTENILSSVITIVAIIGVFGVIKYCPQLRTQNDIQISMSEQIQKEQV